MQNKIERGTIIRTIILSFALINQFLEIAGFCPLPFEEKEIYQGLTIVFTAAASIWAWWKNNSFTKSAIAADKWKDEWKKAAKEE